MNWIETKNNFCNSTKSILLANDNRLKNRDNNG